MTKNDGFRRIYQTVLAFLAWGGAIGNMVNGVLHRDPGVGALARALKSLSYYTNQTNFMVAIWLTLALIYWRREHDQPLLRPKIKGALTVYITITWLIYALFLAQRWEPEGIDLILTILTHWVTPIGFILSWLLFEERRVYQWNYAIQWLLYPLIYLIYAQIYGTITGEYLYFFLDVLDFGWGGVMLNVLALAAFFTLLGCVYIAINRGLKPAAPTPADLG